MPSPFRKSYNTTWILIGLYISVVALSAGGEGERVVEALKFSPEAFRSGEVWRLFTYALIGHDWLDLLMKLLVMFLLAIPVETVWGTQRFLTLLGVTAAGGGLCALLLGQPLEGGSWAPQAALVLTYGFLFQENMISLFLVIPMRVRTFALIVTAVFVGANLQAGRAGWAAIAGLGCGMLYYLVVGYVRWARRARSVIAHAAAHPVETAEQLSAARKIDRVRQIYAAVKKGLPLSDVDREFVSLLGKEAEAGQYLCSPLSFSVDNTICPPCSQIGLCLKRYLEAHSAPTNGDRATA